MSTDEPIPPAPASASEAAIDPRVARWVGLFMIALVAGGFVAFRMLGQSSTPVPAEVAGDPILARGHDVFLGRCAVCHGNEGRGDGPLALTIANPPVGNLTDAEWKHGDRPDQVVAVIGRGVPGTRMEGWGRTLDPADVRSVAAYVYHLAGRTTPPELRKSGR